jgi:two-component system OmpR family sensor kinase
MISLRRTALIWMTVVLVVAGLAGVSVSYWIARNETDGLLDEQLRQVALNAGHAGLTETAGPAVRHDPEDELVIDVWNADGRLIRSSHPALSLPVQKVLGFSNIRANGVGWRIYTSSDGRRIVQVGQRQAVRREIAENAALSSVLPIAAVIPLAWLVIVWALGRFIGHLTRLSNAIAERSVDAETPIALTGVPKEVEPMIDAMNTLIGRLRSSLDQQRRFVSDAAHELRTPLTALRLQIENLRSPGEPGDKTSERLDDLESGVKRATALVTQLLRVARFETPELEPATETVDVAEVLNRCVAEQIPLAGAKGVDLGLDVTAPVFVAGRTSELQILFGNLINNAVRYTPAGGVVDVNVTSADNTIIVEIADTGCGIPHDLLPRAFDRFFRAAPADMEGSGLGLAIVKAIADRQGLIVALANRQNGSGLVATVTGTAIGSPAGKNGETSPAHRQS